MRASAFALAWAAHLQVVNTVRVSVPGCDPSVTCRCLDLQRILLRMKTELPTVNVTRYVTPLREGGSLPAIVEADDLGTYVLKFRGAGQGPLVLVAEIICAGLARGLGLRVPELALAWLDRKIAASEPDQEIQE